MCCLKTVVRWMGWSHSGIFFFLKKSLSYFTTSVLLSLFPRRGSGIISLKNRILPTRRFAGVPKATIHYVLVFGISLS